MAIRSAGSTGVGWLPLLFPLIVVEGMRREAFPDRSEGVIALVGLVGDGVLDFSGEGGTKINSES